MNTTFKQTESTTEPKAAKARKVVPYRRTNKQWKADAKYIRANAGIVDKNAIAKTLGISVDALGMQACKIGIRLRMRPAVVKPKARAPKPMPKKPSLWTRIKRAWGAF